MVLDAVGKVALHHTVAGDPFHREEVVRLVEGNTVEEALQHRHGRHTAEGIS